MRPVLTLIIAVSLLSGIYAYTQFADQVRPLQVEYNPEFAETPFSIRLSRTFDCEGNVEFGLGASLLVLFKDKKVLERTDLVVASETIEIELEDVEVGRNSVYFEANLPSLNSGFSSFEETSLPSEEASEADPFASKSHAMRVEILQEGVVIEDRSFWIEPGLNSVSGAVEFQVASENTVPSDH